MVLTPGARVGAYEIVALLGRGGMGEVWRARDRTLHRDVALKVVSGSLADAPDRLGRFEREGQLLASLNHPHIAAIYGVEQSTAGVALVLELVEGPTLSDLIARGPVPASEALRIGRQIAEALEAAHDRGIIHRDLKPANVKLTSDSEVKVLDFGLAKIADESFGHQDASLLTSPVLGTEAGVILGTAAYMSPEQAKGQAVDRRSDIWSFGCVLYEMLTARRAFEGNSLSEVIVAVLTADVDFARLPDATPPAVRELLRRCLDRSPRGRLRDIGEARIVLEQPDARTSALVPQTAAAGGTRRLGARAAVLLAGTLLIGVLLGAVGASVWMAWRPQALPADGMHFTLPLAPAALLAPSSEYRRPCDTAIAISRTAGA
jgi:eukaryotic-like serine/threonine-protein kinase